MGESKSGKSERERGKEGRIGMGWVTKKKLLGKKINSTLVAHKSAHSSSSSSTTLCSGAPCTYLNGLFRP